MTGAVLARVRFPLDLLTRLDAFGGNIRSAVGKRVPRARLIRAFIVLGLDTPVGPEIVTAIKTDTVRRGREKGKPQGRRA